MLIIGGRDQPGCPPGADCFGPEVPALTDGAALDLVESQWTSIADAPTAFDDARTAVVDGVVYLYTTTYPLYPAGEVGEPRVSFLAYHRDGDTWEELELPPAAPLGLVLAPAGDRVLAYPQSHVPDYRPDQGPAVPDLVYDPAGREWTALPTDPLAPTFDRSLVNHEGRVFAFGVPVNADRSGPANPGLYQAAVLDEGGSWTRLRDSKVIGFSQTWAPISGLIVNPQPGGSDGGETNNFGRSYPSGGLFHPEDLTWSDLPATPGRAGDYYDLPLTVGDRLIAVQGFVLDAAAGIWVNLARPADRPAIETGVATAWVGDQLVVWGGATFDGGSGEVLGTGAVWTPSS